MIIRTGLNAVTLWLSLLIGSLSFASSLKAAEKVLFWASDPLSKVLRSDNPSETGQVLRMEGARGEVVSGQAILRAATELKAVGFAISDLRLEKTKSVIPARAVQLQWVRYIDINRNSPGVPADELVVRAPSSIPDPFWEKPTLTIEAGQDQPLWVEVHVPDNALPGDYQGRLTVTGSDATVQLPVVLHVWNFNVPGRRHLSVINWWSFPGKGFRDVPAYSDAYWKLLDKFCRFLVEHRQTDVQTGISLIRETKKDDGSGYSYDTSRLERYSEVAFAAGIRQIHLHSVGRRSGKIARDNSRVNINEGALRRLIVWDKVIKRRNWQHRFLVNIVDEPFIYDEKTYAAAVERVHKAVPGIRCIEAVEAEYLGNLDIYVPKLSHLDLWYQRFRQLQDAGEEVWFYTCCHPWGRYPNRFLDESLLKVRVLHWLNYLYDLKGYLHWGLNQFATDNPYSQEAISKNLPLGDRAIVYPGKNGLVGSLRFSAMRDGLEDFEYLWVLEHEMKQIKDRVGPDAFWLEPRQRPLELCRRVIWSFHDYTRDNKIMLQTRRAIAEEIEALQQLPLLVVQTSPPEGTALPGGPRVVNVRGLVTPGAKVTLNGKPITTVQPSGYFYQAWFVSAKQPPILTVEAQYQGKKRVITRKFKIIE